MCRSRGMPCYQLLNLKLLKNAGVLENKNKYTARRLWLRTASCWPSLPCARQGARAGSRESGRTRKYEYLSLQSISASEEMNRIDSAGIATRLRAGQPRKPDLIPGTSKRLFYCRKHPDQLWGAPRHLDTGSRMARDTSSSWHAQGRLRPYLLKRLTVVVARSKA